MNCPKCQDELTVRKIKNIEVNECKQCEGIWFEKDQLRKVKDQTDSDLNWMDFEIWQNKDKFKVGSEKYDCPKCAVKMDVLDYDKTKIDIDFCSSCSGVWLDKGELRKIINALEKELLTKSLDDYVKSTLNEAKELIAGPESFISEWNDFSTVLRFLQYRILIHSPKIQKGLVFFQSNPLNK